MTGMSTEQLAIESDTVVSGDVVDVSSHWNEGRTAIVTQATVAVRSVIRGREVSGTIVVEYPGGEVGDVGMKVSDSAQLRKGEQAILFLSGKDHGARFSIVGKGQGAYKVGKDNVARKGGFSVRDGAGEVDYTIPVEKLIEKIKRAPR